MKAKKYLEHINESNWYKQGGAIAWFYVFGAFQGLNEHIGQENDISFQEKEIIYSFFNKDKEKEKLLAFIKKQEKNKKYIDDWIKKWEKLIKKNLIFLKISFEKNIADWNDKRLVNFLRKQLKLMTAHWKQGVSIEWSDPEGEKILSSIIKSYGFDLSDNEIATLIGPTELTFVQAEFINRVKIIKKLKQGKTVEKMIKNHAKDFYWFKNNWAYVDLYDYHCIANLIGSETKNYDKLSAEVESIKQHLRSLQIEKKNIYKKYKFPSGLKNILYLFERMTDWRDVRKKFSVCIVNDYLYKILQRLQAENNLTEDFARMITFKDITGWKLSAKIKSELPKRWQGGVYIADKNNQAEWLYGHDAQVIVSVLNKKVNDGEIKGRIAFPGIVKGVVRVVETKADFAKMKAGDILVSMMTRPEFVPLMKIAAGIVTDEGGLTCHAAIVSRELKKPCVVGTQKATSILKDGDLVELDADRGIVVIL